MKVVKRDIYKKKSDEIVCVAVSEKWAKELVKTLNASEKYKMNGVYYQVVSDDFEIK